MMVCTTLGRKDAQESPERKTRRSLHLFQAYFKGGELEGYPTLGQIDVISIFSLAVIEHISPSPLYGGKGSGDRGLTQAIFRRQPYGE